MMYKGAKSQGWVDDLGDTEAEQDGYVTLIAMAVATGVVLLTMPWGLPMLHKRITEEYDAKKAEEVELGKAPAAGETPTGGAPTDPIAMATVAAPKDAEEEAGSTNTQVKSGEITPPEEGQPGGVMNGIKAMFEGMTEDMMTLDDASQAVHDNAEVFDEKTEMFFRYVQVFTVCCDAFAHGANDVANAVGPLAAIYMVYTTHKVDSKNELGDD